MYIYIYVNIYKNTTFCCFHKYNEYSYTQIYINIRENTKIKNIYQERIIYKKKINYSIEDDASFKKIKLIHIKQREKYKKIKK